MKADDSPFIFISYSRGKDREHAVAIYRQLAACGYSPWIDEEDILPGQVWDQEVESAISSSKIFLALISNETSNSTGFVHDELLTAIEIQKERTEDRLFIIPVRLDDCKIPFLLKRFQWINWFEDTGKERLMKSVAQILGQSSIENSPSDMPDEELIKQPKRYRTADSFWQRRKHSWNVWPSRLGLAVAL
jgi:hypothetical protein